MRIAKAPAELELRRPRALSQRCGSMKQLSLALAAPRFVSAITHCRCLLGVPVTEPRTRKEPLSAPLL